ncbi:MULTISPECIES: 4-oxalocrotonate tautomerase [Planococcus]|uniref:Tautomerase n=2 Tax=Planococcus TaxID=1372 RepID=A0A497YFW1_9BACL|nr:MULTISPECIES: 4-oxalocrotonate tautomerase [Planococcus]RAZ67202.1 4-oxalocrotonate tautomerase [Planococcus maitriensis]RLJ86726.1 4-oxalocrotonate tautomerase [Planococcus citreus]
MPFVQITIAEGREPEKKEQLISEVTATVSDVLGAPKENIRILLTEVPTTHWGIAGQSISKRKEESK